jgi:biotin carboxylase
MRIDGSTLLVVGAGYTGKRRAYQRMNELGASLVIADEPGHWSQSLVAEGLAKEWLSVPITGDAPTDAIAIVDALGRTGVRPDGVLTIWENSICVAARVAEALGLPGNPSESTDAARSKIWTREMSARLGLPTPRAQRVRSLDELFAAAEYVGFPAVVKPEFGASAVGCVRVDDFDDLPHVYTLVRDVVRPEHNDIFRAGNDLLLEEYLDGVEFDVDLVLQNGRCAFSSVSQNWPTAEPSFQETGLHCPADHNPKAVKRLVDLSVQTVQAFGFRGGVLHVEGKCTSRGPRIIEVNARMGGGRVFEMVRDVWGVDLVEAQLRSALDLPVDVHPSRKPRCHIVDKIVHAPNSGVLAALPLPDEPPKGCLSLDLDVYAKEGDDVVGPEEVFASVLVEVTLVAKDLRTARALVPEVLRAPPVVVPRGA